MRASTFFIINAIILIYLIYRIYSSGQKRSRPSVSFEMFDIFSSAPKGPREKSLNCPFDFKGQKYDAYEVLGVPAGAPIEICQNAFGQSDRGELFQAAMNALKKQ